jgi:hypothetical protein
MPIVYFIIGVLIGALSVMLWMRERILRLEAELDLETTRRTVASASGPGVKKRKLGSGPAKPRKKVAKTVPKLEQDDIDAASEEE